MKGICRFVRKSCLVAILAAVIQLVSANNSDRFNYRETVGNDYGPKDWDKVSCSDIGSCQGWPDGYKLGVGWELGENNCKWCPADGNHTCGMHHQSPIDLLRTAAETGHDSECHDYHWIVSSTLAADKSLIRYLVLITKPLSCYIHRHMKMEPANGIIWSRTDIPTPLKAFGSIAMVCKS